MVGKVMTNMGRLNDKENYPSYNERYHTEFNNVVFDRSSLNEETLIGSTLGLCNYE